MIYPMFAMVLLTLAVAAYLLWLRILAIKSGDVRLSEFRLYQREEWPDRLIQASRNYSNLFELPVLFYAAGATAIALQRETLAIVVLGWLFVASRVIHSFIHLHSNRVVNRFKAFVGGFICVMAIWVLLILGQLQS